VDLIERRRFINKTFSTRCIYISKESLSFLNEQMGNLDQETCSKTLNKIITMIEKDGVDSDLLGLEHLKRIIKSVSRNLRTDGEIAFKLENSIEWRKSIAAKSDIPYENPWEMLGFHCMRHRFELLKKSLNNSMAHLSTIDSLFSRRNAKVSVLGMLSRESGSEFSAEDFNGSVHLNLKGATYEPGIYFEGGIFIFEGIYESGLLSVEKVSLPNLECHVAEKQTDLSKKNADDRIVLFSDVHLDNPRVMKALYSIFDGFKSNPPNVFIFCGPFLSVQLAYEYTEGQATAFRHLANIFTEFALHYPNTQYILVPSPEDPPPIIVLPRSPFHPSVTQAFKDARNVHFASNPCRLVFRDQNIVIFRNDMVEKLCRTAIHVPEDAKVDTLPKLFFNTIWSQRHYSPLPLHFNPINPRFDPLFYLSPAPDLLVIADKYKLFTVSGPLQTMLTINPGSFVLSNFEFLVYFPNLKKIETSIYVEKE